MASYRLEISATAERQLKRLPRRDLGAVVEAIERLRSNPRPRGSRKLSGYRDVYRIRVGVYRILYSVERALLLIVILKVGHRKNVYR
jgi:mRNA interferase RelE/StbE